MVASWSTPLDFTYWVNVPKSLLPKTNTLSAHRQSSQLTKETGKLARWRDKIIFHNVMSRSKEGILQYLCSTYSLVKGWIAFVRSVNNALVTSCRFNKFFPPHPERPPVCSCETLWTTRIISSLVWPGLKDIQPVTAGEAHHLLQIKTAEPQEGGGKEQDLYRKIPLLRKCQACFPISETLVSQISVSPLLPPYPWATVNSSNGRWKKQAYIHDASFFPLLTKHHGYTSYALNPMESECTALFLWKK